jgi:rubrerythrin
MELSEVVGTKLTMEELSKLIGVEDLYVLNDQLSDFGLSQCIVCGTWVYEVNDDWECPDCEGIEWT